MMDIILKLIKESKDSFVQKIKARHVEFYNRIVEQYVGDSFSEKIYRWLNEEDLNCGKCIRCSTPAKFLNIRDGFRKYCSSKCANIGSADVRSKTMTRAEKDLNVWEQKECGMCGKQFWAYKKRNGRFCSNSCSAKFTANDPTRLQKIKTTKVEKYGCATYVNPEKAKQTCIDRYAVDNVSKSREVIDKIKCSNFKKYGTDWSWQSEEVKDKIRKTNLEKYGTENPSQSPLIKQRRISSYLKKYGVMNPFQCADIKEDIRIKYKSVFGVEYPSQIDDVRKKISETVRKNNYRLLCDRVKNDIEVLFDETEYKGAESEFKYRVKCKKCRNEFSDHFDGNGHPRCLICHPNLAGFSYAEREITEFIKSFISDQIIEKDRSLLGNRELDIYIPSKKLALEYNGLFWHSEANGKKLKCYHLDKLTRCQQRGVRLITIFEDEWENNRNIIKSKLLHILSRTSHKVYARNCSILKISSKQSNLFLDRTHLQGGCNASIHLGLFDESNVLVAVMTFGKLRISLGYSGGSIPGEYEMLRYATLKSVVGGASKLFAYFLRTYNSSKVISYSDNRWGTGEMYKKMGFTEKESTKPNYWYFKPGYAVRYHRFNFRKNVLFSKLNIFDPELTEWENMQLNGYDRIWDCGNNKYIWNRG